MEKRYRNMTWHKLLLALSGCVFVAGVTLLALRRPFDLLALLLFIGIDLFFVAFFLLWMKYPRMRSKSHLARRDGRWRQVTKVFLVDDPDGYLYLTSGLYTFILSVYILLVFQEPSEKLMLVFTIVFMVLICSVAYTMDHIYDLKRK